jgi:Glycosyltransferase family 87
MKFGRQHWRVRHILLWALLVNAALWWQGPAYLRALKPDYAPAGVGVLFIPDFFQEWASARNLFNGLPVYTSQTITVERYLEIRTDSDNPWFIEVNAHPPTSILLALPFAGFSFPAAFLLWNLLSAAALAASLLIIVHQLKIRASVWASLPVVTLLLFCFPFWDQLIHGQLNLILLLLITGVWATARTGHPWWAGVLLGAATAIKLFPVFLCIYFLARKEWKVLAATTATFIGLTLLTGAILGPGTYPYYITSVMPRFSIFRYLWYNQSLVGFWTKLFDPAIQTPWMRITPILNSHLLALVMIGVSCVAVTAIVALVSWRARTQPAADMAFGLALTGMLLLTPIVWDHYTLMLALPLAVLWCQLPQSEPVRWTFYGATGILWLPPAAVMEHVMTLLGNEQQSGGGFVAGPLEILTALSIHTYAVLTLFILGIALAMPQRRSAAGNAGVTT